MAEVLARVALDHVQLVRRRLADLIEPSLAVEAAGVDDERVAFPMTRRVAEPSRVRVRSELAAVEEDLAPERERFVHDDHEVGRLHELPRRRRRADPWHTLRQAVRVGVLARMRAVGALVGDLPRPRLERYVLRFQVRGDVAEVLVRVRIPNPGEVGAAVLRARRGRREIGLAVCGERDLARHVLPPLRVRTVGQSGCAEQHRERESVDFETRAHAQRLVPPVSVGIGPSNIFLPVVVSTIDFAFARRLPSLARLPSTVITSSVFSESRDQP